MTEPRVTYREVLGMREFRAIFLSQGLSVLGDQVTRIAVALLVFERSGSALAASATYACSYLTWLVGGPFLSALADRHPRRRIMIACDVGRALLVAVLLIPDLPLWAVFAVLILVGFLAPPFDSARGAVLPEILPGDRYIVGNALMNAVFQGGQVGGFLAGGALVALLGVRGALLVDIATFVVSALALIAAVEERPVARDAAEPSTLLRDVVEGVKVVAHTPRLRWLLAWSLVNVAAIIPAEGLAVAVSDELGRGSVTAGVLTAAVPAGFLVGSVLVLRLPPERRTDLLPALMVLTCLPLLLTAWAPQTELVVALWVLAGVGNALQLVTSAAYVSAAPAEVRGRAYGIAGTALMAVQGIALLAGGFLAEAVDARRAIVMMAACALVATPLVMLLSRGGKHVAQGNRETRRATT